MRYLIFSGLLLSFIWVSPVLAAKKKAEPKEQPPAVQVSQEDKLKQEKEELGININKMRSQEIRVAVLNQLLNEEVNKLNNVQADFCKQYNLDLDKLRKGLYRYDDAQGKFVEQAAAVEERK